MINKDLCIAIASVIVFCAFVLYLWILALDALIWEVDNARPSNSISLCFDVQGAERCFEAIEVVAKREEK